MKILIALLAILIALAVLNPEMQDFRGHVEDTIGEKLASETGSQALSRLGAGAVALMAEQVSMRKNYFIFSTYTIDLDGSDRDDADWQFLGVAGMFFQLREPGNQLSGEAPAGS